MIAWPLQRRQASFPAALVACGLALCAWQVEEHLHYARAARANLIKRGQDITSTLGVVLRSQRRFGLIVVKERIEPALQALLQTEEVQSVALLSADGELLASAGEPIAYRHELAESDGVHWGRRALTMMNPVDLGPAPGDGGPGAEAAVVMSDDEQRSLRPHGGAARAPAPEGGPRPALGRPSWMTAEQYDLLLHAHGVHSFVIKLATADLQQGIRHDLLLRALVCLLAAGGTAASVMVLRSNLRTAELQIGLVKADEMNTHLRAMNLAAAGLAHETRNPLNLIRGFAQMIASHAEQPPKLKAYATQIVEEADRVTMQLDAFINYSRPREAHVAPVEVRALAADVARTLLPDVEEKHLTLVLPEAPCVVEADDQLFRQALFNVLLNATQAAGPGGRIEVRVVPTGPQEVALEVADDGPGVPPAERENVFKPYFSLRTGGVGLGLAIVRQIAAALRWEVSCEPNAPRGARFRFSRLRLTAAPG